MKTISSLVPDREKIIKFFKSQDFIKAILMAVAMVIPITVGVRFDLLEIAELVALGVFFASPSDSTGSLRLKVNGMLLATLLALLITTILHFIRVPFWGLIPLIGLFIFCISYLSIYGFRASLIGFSGLFALVLSFSPFSDSEIPIYYQVLWIGLGGLWYISLVVLRHVLFPKSATEYYLAETLKVTGDYLEIRSKLIDNKNDRKQLIKELLESQTLLTDHHETLRDLLISRRKGSGKSTYQVRRLLIFQQLVDILELAMANPVNYFKADEVFEENSETLNDFQHLMLAMSQRLNYIGKNFSKPQKIQSSDKIRNILNKIEADIKMLANEKEEHFEEHLLTLKNYWKYQNNQFDRIKKIEMLIRNRKIPVDSRFKNIDRRGFLTRQEYRLNVLIENFNITSTIFRHSLRIAVVAMIGYSFGMLFEVEKPYWILLTIVVIMRPNFGLTKSRLKQRAIGTLIGGGVAFLIIILIHNSTLYGILSITSFVIGFSMVQRNYKAAAAFLTMYILFVYALISPEVFGVIQYRLLDTLIGAALAFSGNLLLWPAWEIKSIDKTLKEAIEANRNYLKEIAEFYNSKSEQLTAYRLSRKKAFLRLSDLSSSFQRMTQEPKSQHKNLDEVFQLVMLMHSFLASLASLGTYFIHNPTTPASEGFNQIVDNIKKNLLNSEQRLENLQFSKSREIHAEDNVASQNNEKNLKTMVENQELYPSRDINSTKEEVHLVSEQFKWLLSNSNRMSKILQEIHFK